MAVPGTDPLAGGVALSRYQVEGLAAHGGMASVYRAHDPVLNRRVALKVLHSHLAADPSCVERFRREARSAAGLMHPGIISIFDSGEVEGRPCLVMEYMPGGSLADRLSRGPLSVDEAAAVGMTVARALHEAHRRGVVHRDVKPANILFTESGTAKLGDFGIAKAQQDGLTQTGHVIGTARYLAPEQLRGRPATPASDQFALGVVLYEALAGRPPFGGPSDPTGGLMRPGPPPPLASVVRVPAAVDAVVNRALADAPEHRFPDLEQMARALGAAAHPGAGHHAATTTGPPTGLMPASAAAGDGRYSAHPPTAAVGHAWSPAPPTAMSPPGMASRPPPPPPRRSRRRGGRALVVLILLSVLAAAGVLAVRLAADAGRPRGGPGGSPGTGGEAGDSLPTVAAFDFDPFSQDGRENPDLVDNVRDGNPDTAWQTQRYNDASPFPVFKPGVGIFVDLGDVRPVSHLRVTSDQQGWEAEIRVAEDGPPGDLEGFAVVGRVSADEPETAIEGRARFVLVWIVHMQGPGSLRINEIEVFGG